VSLLVVRDKVVGQERSLAIQEISNALDSETDIGSNRRLRFSYTSCLDKHGMFKCRLTDVIYDVIDT
jgi:hypothetical protein